MYNIISIYRSIYSCIESNQSYRRIWGISKYRISGYANRYRIESWRTIWFTPLVKNISDRIISQSNLDVQWQHALMGLATCPVLPPALDRPFSQGFPRKQSNSIKRKWQLQSSAPTPDLVADLLKMPFSRRSFAKQENNWEKRPTPKLISLTKACKVFMRHFKDCNYECYHEWLTASILTIYFVDRVYFLKRVKEHRITDPWTLFTSDRWVLYYLMSIV